VSISGSTGKGEGLGLLDPKFIANMVYPVISAVKVRRNPMVVSAGSTGGGGLDAYGALKCARIYTIFLPMPGASWTMQYCQQANSIVNPKPAGPTTVVHLAPGLVPPDPDTESRYDFKRLPVPPEKSRKLIVLKGMLEKDGTVDGLTIFQSVVPAMDEAARIAFSRWRFRPASLEGTPVAVEILVGIPAEIAGAQQTPQINSSPTR
jgi:Gram-negative bacterial TonB protein C-terminal